MGFDQESVKTSLKRLIKVIEETPQKTENPQWWETNFRLFWLHDNSKEEPSRTRLTKYVVYQLRGSQQKSPKYAHALWEIPPAAQFRTQYTRKEILQGVLEKEPTATPLVWLRKQDVLEAQMQGSIEVHLEDGSKRLFNVHVSNEFPYQKGVSSEKQKRYWFFREVDHVFGWGQEDKIPILPLVSFAGDIENFGLGHPLWISTEETTHIGILCDTGGAFQPNLGHFDWFIGFARNRNHFFRKAKRLPRHAKVGFLLPR